MENENFTGTGEQANVDTVATDTNDAQVENNGINNESTPPVVNEEPKTKTFTQEQVNHYVTRRVERERNTVLANVYKRLGIENEDGIESLTNKAKEYDSLNEKYNAMADENTQLKRKLLFIEKNIADNRKDDVIAHFKGKEMELNDENLTRELQTHPEWLHVTTPTENPKPQTTIKELGSQRGYEEADDERKRAMRLFGFKD